MANLSATKACFTLAARDPSAEMNQSMNVVHFGSTAAFRIWLEQHHDSAAELWVGFYRKDSGRGGLIYSDAVDEALCFGWIDGVRRKIDANSYTNRFTPRRARSNWSLANIRRVAALKRAGRMTPAGLKAFGARVSKRTGTYSFEQTRKNARLGAVEMRALRAAPDAWDYFRTQPPYYQRVASWWVMSAKREETRRKRLGVLIASSARGVRVPPLQRPGDA